MKLVVISDTHVHPWSAFATGTGADNSRLRRTLDVMRDSLERAREEDAPWIHAGDVIHTTGHVRHPVASAMLDLLGEYSDVPMVMVRGNHDSRGRGSTVAVKESFHHTLERVLPELTLLEGRSAPYRVRALSFTGLGAQPDVSMLDVADLPDADVAVFHAPVAGASFPSGMVTDGLDPDLLRRFPLSICGDIHHPHVDREDGSTILIPGAPEHHNFGDKGDRGWWVVDIEPGVGVRDIEFVESGSPRFLTVDSAKDVCDDGNFYRVLGDVSGDVPENATVVSPGPSTVEARDLLKGAREVRDVLARWIEETPPPRTPGRYLAAGVNLVDEADVTSPRPAFLEGVHIRNFMSHEDTEWSIEPGVHAIVGRGSDHGSNGAGKSAAAEAVFWALYNRTTKGTAAADVIRWGADECSVELRIVLPDAVDDGREMVVRRTRRSSGGDLEVTLDGEPMEAPTTRDLGAELVRTLGLSEGLFRCLGYFSQEDVVLLSRGTDAQIKGYLADLMNGSMYDEAASRARKRAAEFRTSAERVAGRVEALTEEVENGEATVTEHEDLAAQWDEGHEEDLADAMAALAEARRADEETTEQAKEAIGAAAEEREAKIASLDVARADRVEARQRGLVKSKSSALNAERVRLETDIQNLRSKAAKVPADEADEIVGKMRRKVGRLRTEANGHRSRATAERDAADRARAEIERLDERIASTEKGVCSACGQPLPDASEVMSGLRTERDEAADAASASDESARDADEAAADAQSRADRAADALAKAEAGAKARRSMETKLARVESIREQEARVEETALARAEREADEWVREREREIREAERKVVIAWEEAISHAMSAVGKAERAVEDVEKQANPHRHAAEQKRADVLDLRRRRWSAHRSRRAFDRDAEVMDYWAGGMGRSGIQSLLADELAAEFNARRGRVFPTLTRGIYDVEFATTSTTQAGELRERIEFRVRQGGRSVPYANLSGGQRRRVDLGVLLTMTLAVSRIHGVAGTLGIMVLDEVTSYLDEDGEEALAETLAEYVEDVVPSVYVVSQDESMQALLGSTLVVEQDADGVSRLLRG